MWLLVYIPAIAGIWRYRFWGFWKWVVAMFLWQSVADFLFAAGGTLDQPQGDGLITGMVRRASNDGVEVALLGVGFWIVFLIGVVLIVSQMRKAARQPPAHAEVASNVPVLRRIAETGGLTLAIAALMFVSLSAMMSAKPLAATQDAYTLEQEVADAAVEIRRTVPQQIDPSTKLVGVRSSGRVLIYDYELSERGTPEQMRDFFAKNSLARVCADAVMRPEMRRGVTFRYSYMLIGQDAPVEIDVSEAVCAATVGDRSDRTQQ